jgi:cell division septation protein DedD
MNFGGRLRRMIRVAGLGLVGCALHLRAQEMSAPEFPVEAYKKNDKGIVVAHVKFAADGKVESCVIVRSNVPFPLEAATVDYIQRKWIVDWLAGETVTIPVTYDELPWYATHWNEDLVPPPNLLPLGDPGRKLKLRITFGKDSWVDHVQVIEGTGIELVDRQTAIWVKVHWHNDAFAGQTLDTPFVFKTPPGSKVAATAPAPAPPKRKPAPPATTFPTEPESPPAVRAQ